MSKRYSFAAMAGAAMLFVAPALADGYANKPVQRGPAPLKAHAPEANCELLGADEWYCPPRETVAQPATRTWIDESQTRHYVTRYTTGGECCGAVSPPPVQRVHAQPGITIDASNFGGGVGTGVGGGGGYYGGGGFAYARASASAGAWSSAGARIAFSGRYGGGHKGGGGGGCGCR